MKMQQTITTFYVVRHGETEWNKQGLFQGNLDSPLSELGVRQANALAAYFTNCKYDKIVTSDLSRAVKTAEAICNGTDITILQDIRLRERNLGIAQGLTAKEFAAKYPNEYKNFSNGTSTYEIPDGESICQRLDRSVACMNDLAEKYSGKSIVVVTHGGILDGLFRYVTGIPLESKRKFSLLNASVNTFQVYNGEWNIVTWGYVEHLRSLGSLDDWYRGAI